MRRQTKEEIKVITAALEEVVRKKIRIEFSKRRGEQVSPIDTALLNDASIRLVSLRMKLDGKTYRLHHL